MEDMRLSLRYRPASVEVNGVRFELCRTDAQIVQDVMELAERASRMVKSDNSITDFDYNHALSGDFLNEIPDANTSSHVAYSISALSTASEDGAGSASPPPERAAGSASPRALSGRAASPDSHDESGCRNTISDVRPSVQPFSPPPERAAGSASPRTLSGRAASPDSHDESACRNTISDVQTGLNPPSSLNPDSTSNHTVSGVFHDELVDFNTISNVQSTKIPFSPPPERAADSASPNRVQPSPALSPAAALAAYLDTLLGAGARARIAATLPDHPAPLGNAPSAAISQAIILQAARAYANAFALRYGDAPEAAS